MRITSAVRNAWNLTRPRPTVWQVGLAAPPDNRLSPQVFDQLAERLDEVEAAWRDENRGRADEDKTGGALVVTSDIPKFFSNGLSDPELLKNPDFVHSENNLWPGLTEDVFNRVNYRLLTFPLITVAAVNGHAFAGGMITALCCDYRLATAGRALWSLNELLIGVPIPGPPAAIMRAKMTPNVLQEAVLGKRWSQPELLASGIAHEVVEPEQLAERAVALGEQYAPNVRLGAWGTIKENIYQDVADQMARQKEVPYPDVTDRAFQLRRSRETKL